MTKADHFQKRAEEADAHAEKATDAEIKRTWVNIAAHWREMAKQAERNGW